ncbi:MAG: hypothetical protein WC729_13165 [Sphingomonas sp.]|jgi:hypothetical protein|uniref:hypothetical protein n=1 Tax=Sphingomonas sp. TaxID=28214 RepID=UPI00356AC80E
MLSDDILWKCMAAVMAVGAIATASPATAQDMVAEVDALIDASTTPDQALALARSQEGQGDLLGAAATLERVLFRQADQQNVAARLYYIALLCKLDDRQRARIETTKLAGFKVSDAGLGEAQQACGAITVPASAPARSANGLTGEITAGIAYDSDAFGALLAQFDLGAPAVRDDGLSFVASARFDGRAQAGTGYVYGGISAQTKDSVSGPKLDYQIGTGRIGYGNQLGGLDVSFGAVGRYGRIAGKEFVGEYGGQIAIAMPGDTHRVTLRGEVVHQDYAGSRPVFDRDGTRYDLALDYAAEAGAKASYVIGGAFEQKTAETAYLGYTGGRIYAAARLPIDDSGTYAGLSATVRHLAYRTNPLGNRQIETRLFGRAAIGTPIGDTGFDIEAAASYSRRDYNRTSFLHDYDNVGSELRLIYKFGR